MDAPPDGIVMCQRDVGSVANFPRMNYQTT